MKQDPRKIHLLINFHYTQNYHEILEGISPSILCKWPHKKEPNLVSFPLHIMNNSDQFCLKKYLRFWNVSFNSSFLY